MTHLQFSDVDLCEQIPATNPFDTGSTALLTPDRDRARKPSETEPWSDYLTDPEFGSPLCASGDDLDDDEAYFLDDDDDDDDDIEEDYEDDDFDDEDINTDSTEDLDDEEL